MQPFLGQKPNWLVEGKEEKTVWRLPLSQLLTIAIDWVTSIFLQFQV